jgi:hypothetical protein
VIASSHAPFLPSADDNDDDELIESAGSRSSEPRYGQFVVTLLFHLAGKMVCVCARLE